MADRSQKALAEFLSEAQETIEALGKGLMRLDAAGGDADPDHLNAVFRAAHSLKGLSSMFGVERMARLAHALEDLLDDLRMGRRTLDRGAVDLLLETPEVFSRIIAEEAEDRLPQTTDAADRLVGRLRAAEPAVEAGGEDPLAAIALGPEVRRVLTEYEEHRLRVTAQKGLALYGVHARFALGSFDRDLAALTGRLKALGEVISTLPSGDAADAAIIAFELLFASREPLDAVAAEAGTGATVEPIGRRASAPDGTASPARRAPEEGAGPAPRPAPSVSPAPEPPDEEPPSLRSVSQAVRVDIRKLDRLMTIVGELVLVKSSLLAVAERLKVEGAEAGVTAELQRANRTLDRRLAELQSGILEVRMVPLDQVFDKLARTVRKTAREAGKEIDFRMEGGDVELDKLIVEDLSDPLMHLLRNAVDHAIEAPEVRERMGKPRAGRVTLAAAQRGNHVRITVEDDGGGIDEERIREVAVQRGLATLDEVRDLPRREVMNLIFVPGFSTARRVTALSGRGVGMDVVKSNIASLSGIIDLATEKGRGTRFELTLPVTLAIIRALVVSVAGRVYGVPLNGVLEILELRSSDVRTISTREVVSLRGATLPLVRLSRLFGLSQPQAPDAFFVVVVGLAQERLGIAVDDVVGQQDVVVKPLGPALAGVRGIAGATDLGTRSTVLVLDVGAIIEDVVRGEGMHPAVC
ncbi:MAG TPA: chemotaxis protein CheA [Anaeromyxobacteraceae bacterium]|nr:chemotaxis protein CheA [Anaeromyxobacteraceae bacterium]